MKLSEQDKKVLRQASAVKELSEHPGWVDHLKPMLEVKRDKAFPDPAKFKSIKEFTYAALASSALKKAVAEILMWVELQNHAHKDLTNKKKDKTKNKFRTGG